MKSFLVVAIHPRDSVRPSSIALPPSMPSSGGPAKKWVHAPVYSPSSSRHKNHHTTKQFHTSAPEPTYSIHSHTDSRQGSNPYYIYIYNIQLNSYILRSFILMMFSEEYFMKCLGPSVSPFQSPLSSSRSWTAPALSPTALESHYNSMGKAHFSFWTFDLSKSPCFIYRSTDQIIILFRHF